MKREHPSTSRLYTAGWRAAMRGEQLHPEHPDMFRLGYEHAKGNIQEKARRTVRANNHHRA